MTEKVPESRNFFDPDKLVKAIKFIDEINRLNDKLKFMNSIPQIAQTEKTYEMLDRVDPIESDLLRPNPGN